ncbi:hypothetical protein G9A89_004433 [Geosiphon pyriformis]|nr:hypothetical protein G9A89_004433 [Geosiphon pyriformis]
MPVNSNIVKPLNNPNRFGPQPGGGMMSRSGITVVNPAQQAGRPGPMNSPYQTNSMAQRAVGGNPLMARTNGRIGSNVPSWNYTPGSSLTTQNLAPRQQQQFPGYQGSANTTASNASTSGLGSSYATTAGTGSSANGPNDGRSLHHQQPIQELTYDDFPALPGASSNSTSNRSLVGNQSSSQHHLVNHQQSSALDSLTSTSSLATSLPSASLQDGRLSLGGIRTTVQPPINSLSEQDKKNYVTKGNSLHSQVQQQSLSTAMSSSLNPYSLAENLRSSTPYLSTSTLVGVPSYSMTGGISNLHNSNNSTINQSPSSSSMTSSSGDFYGLMGLLNVIRMTDPDLSMLALGSDLSTLGLNLNSPDSALYTTFTSPWADNNQLAGLIEPEYHLPSCYNAQPPPPAQKNISSLLDETLFYIFYSMPRDYLQEVAAQELYNRNWRYHRDHKLWLTKEPGTEPFQKTAAYEHGSYIFFDPNNWEKIKKDAVLMYEALEERPLMGGLSGNMSQAASLSLAPGGLHQQGMAAQGLSNVNMAGLMGLGGMPTNNSGAGGMSSAALGGLGTTPAHMQQLHHTYPSVSNAGQHHQLGGPLLGLGQNSHYVAQGGLKEF